MWIVFSMREEYFPRLDDYRDLIPTGLECRVRLSLLSFEQAIEAIREPAKMSNIILPKDDGRDAAEYIVEELSKFRKRMAGEIAVYQEQLSQYYFRLCALRSGMTSALEGSRFRKYESLTYARFNWMLSYKIIVKRFWNIPLVI